MALSESELNSAEKVIQGFLAKRRPPLHIRSQLDIGYRITGQSVELFEIRPRWDEPTAKMEHPIAKATFVKSNALWKVYWQQADLKWHSFEPMPQVGTLEKFLALVDEDKYGCFFG